MLYFAYASNMDWDQMRKRCPSSRFKCIASLKDYQLAFTRYSKTRKYGVADVVPYSGHDIWGVVYQIDETDIASLDQGEGYQPSRPSEANAYVREERYVYAEGNDDKPLLVSLYVANKENNPPLPDAAYKKLIVEGAKYWHLPSDYIAELERIEAKT